MGDPGEHGELVILRQPKPLRHPREVVRQREVPSQHTLRLPFGPAREAQRRRRIRANEHTRRLSLHRRLRLQTVRPGDVSTAQLAVVAQAQRGDLGLDLEVARDELGHGVGELAGVLGGAADLDEEGGVRDLEEDLLAVGGVLGVEDRDGGAGLEGAHVGDDEVDAGGRQRCSHRTGRLAI